jgi:small subunit ribosomal protein S14
MAKKSSIEKNNKKIQLSKKYYKYRQELRSKSLDSTCQEEERQLARKKLQALPANTSHVRSRLRCSLTGRPRGNYRKFGLSRMAFRQLALIGKIPGVTKASW